MSNAPGEVQELIEPALAWMISSACEDDGGALAWAEKPSDSEPAGSLYMGTAGVVTTLLEAYGALGEHRYAELAERGARWSNVEHKNPDPDLEPQPGWAHGNAGIVRELLRYASSDGKPASLLHHLARPASDGVRVARATREPSGRRAWRRAVRRHAADRSGSPRARTRS